MFAPVKETFLYFAYGSNLLKQKIRINIPSAELIGIGRLDNHQINFIKYSDAWKGSLVTIVPVDNDHVWGAIWRIQNKDMPALDCQEGVDTNYCFPKTVDIKTPDGAVVQCRTYQQSVHNPPLLKDVEEIPMDRRPSITYLKCFLKGAEECNLPKEYLIKLRKIPHNDKKASQEIIEKLNMD